MHKAFLYIQWCSISNNRMYPLFIRYYGQAQICSQRGQLMSSIAWLTFPHCQLMIICGFVLIKMGLHTSHTIPFHIFIRDCTKCYQHLTTCSHMNHIFAGFCVKGPKATTTENHQ